MQVLVRINGHTGYVEIEDNNPYATPLEGKRGLFLLPMEITDSPDWQVGETVTMLFKRGQVEILEDS